MWKRDNEIEMHGKVPAEISWCGSTKGGTGLAKKFTQAFHKMVPKTRMNFWANPLFISRSTLLVSPVAVARETVEQSRWGVGHEWENHSDALKKASADCTGRCSRAARLPARWECWPVRPQLLPTAAGHGASCFRASWPSVQSLCISLLNERIPGNGICCQVTLLFSIYPFINTQELTQKQQCADLILR